ncbi:hypothetical protein [Nocardioides currus]|uniref:Uncharacterized protein n=1 Tax=Nocardioides currus TaxID=2133958 RepID=A0A2R7YRN4_9ACTN|nr:hypothetical protein [Nocardioides currus]PUA79032.1 hypothetical protein C7S10_21395 [Nocardioides currus]
MRSAPQDFDARPHPTQRFAGAVVGPRLLAVGAAAVVLRAIWDVPARLRSAAQASGATPEPAPTDETAPPPDGIRPAFSW